MNLTEATILALQGKLNLEENKKITRKPRKVKKEEAININTDEVNVAVDTENKVTSVDTEKETIVVAEKEPEEVVDVAVETDETIDVPVEGDETIVPEEEVSEDTVEEIIDEESTEEPEEVEEQEAEEIVEESKELKTESDATPEFLEDLKNLLNKHTRVGQIDKLELDETGDKVIVTYPNGATKEINIEADSNSAAIKDILKVIESKEVKTEEVKTEEVEEKSLYQEIKESDKGLYDFVANEYYRLSKEDLKEIALDAIYVADKDEEILAEIKDRTELVEGKDKDCKHCEECKNSYNKESFEEVLTKFYKFNSKKVESFTVSSVAQNKKGNLKIEGKLNNKVPVTMIFNKKLEGKSFTKYTLTSTNNILKESKDITTNMLLVNKDNKLECKYIISK